MPVQPPGTSRDLRPLPDQVTMGLLPYLTTHALDDDYAAVAAREPDRTTGARRPIGLAGAVALALFAVLAITAGVQTSKDSASEERERRALIDQVKDRKASLDADRRRIAELRTETDRLESDLLDSNRSSRAVLDQLRLLSLRSGTSAVRGPGVEIVVDDAPDAQSDRNRVLDTDLQKLVNGLWRAGAEAISINGQRLTNLSAIRNSGSAINVNFTSLSRPYRILAIGDRSTLPAKFADTSSGQTWLDLQRQVGLRFTMRTQSTVRLPAAETPSLRYAAGPTTQGKRHS